MILSKNASRHGPHGAVPYFFQAHRLQGIPRVAGRSEVLHFLAVGFARPEYISPISRPFRPPEPSCSKDWSAREHVLLGAKAPWRPARLLDQRVPVVFLDKPLPSTSCMNQSPRPLHVASSSPPERTPRRRGIVARTGCTPPAHLAFFTFSHCSPRLVHKIFACSARHDTYAKPPSRGMRTRARTLLCLPMDALRADVARLALVSQRTPPPRPHASCWHYTARHRLLFIVLQSWSWPPSFQCCTCTGPAVARAAAAISAQG